jgi:hypothetical protein
MVIDMRNSSTLIQEEEDLDAAEEVIVSFNRLIIQHAGNPIYSESTGDGFLLIYDESLSEQGFEVLNRLMDAIQDFVVQLRISHPTLDLGYGIGMHKSTLKLIRSELENHDIVFLVGQCVNTASKYAYYHNRTTLQHKHYQFDGVLMTKGMSDALDQHGYEPGEPLKEASGFKAYRLERFIRKGSEK